ncbi:hypothetical protein CHS0354_014106 [Potamilus streckersoni]|uniref:Uncharacterized protein n=1 Tax=Potamilus streckersoni TaxID=2493646 RepID=A0AAE0WF22_9BIVA|nr:hypothetical protein CHS0354_014106 [Potamilus streckersoni]
MRTFQHRPIFVFICIITFVVLFVQVNYTNYTKKKRIFIESDELLKETKKALSQQHLGNIVVAEASDIQLKYSELNSNISLYNDVNRGFKIRPIITLFTSFKTDHVMDSDKVLVYNNTLYNWQTLKPHVQLIFFTLEINVTDKVNFLDWNIVTLLNNSKTEIPIFKAMYVQANKLYNTSWYGYFNGDILLTEDILETLDYVSSVSDNFPNASILIIGRRINVLNVTSEEVRNVNGIKESARSRGSLYEIDAEDYFITNRLFPWAQIPEFVIGRAGYDNWIVGQARCDLGTIVIDATETLTAVHQTTNKGGNKEGFAHSNKNYNFELIQRLKLPRRFLQGLTTCAEWRTFRTIKTGRIELVKRDDLHKNCKCKK